MNLLQLRCLVALADCDLRLAVAANHARVSERMLLDQVKLIEGELGLPIVLRRGRRVEAITRAGVGIIRRARVLLEGVASIQRLGPLDAQHAATTVVIRATHTQARHTLPDALAQFRKLYPQTMVLVRQPAHLQGQRKKETSVDLEIHSTSGQLPSGGPAIPLFSWRRCLVVPREHPLAAGDAPITLARIADYPLISYHPSTRRESSLQLAFSRQGLTPKFSVTTLNADLVKTYVRINAGIGILPEMVLSDQDHALFACFLLPGVADCITWAVVPGNARVSDSTLQLIRLLAPHLATQPLGVLLQGKVSPGWSQVPPWRPKHSSAVADAANPLPALHLA